MTNVAKPPLARKLLLAFLAANAGAAAWAQSSPTAQGVAGGGIARIESPWSIRENPGALPFLDGGAVAAAIIPPPVAIDGFAGGSVLAIIPVDSTSLIGASLDVSGIPGYVESAATATAALPIGPDIGVGTSITFNTLSIERYGTATALHLGVGLLGRPGRQIRVGGSLAGIGIGGNAGRDVRPRVGLGFAFDLQRTTTLSVDVTQELRRGVMLSLGLSGTVADGVTLRGGIGSGPPRLSAGLTIAHDRIIVDYGAGWIVPLGFRQMLGAGFRW